MRRIVAIVGTAGRGVPVSPAAWEAMRRAVLLYLRPGDAVVSGGAAGADHAAVWAYLSGLVEHLTLHLPAPLSADGFFGPPRSSGATANFYHSRFLHSAGVPSLTQLHAAVRRGAEMTCQPEAEGFASMRRRNLLIADQCTHMLAMTYSGGGEPDGGGTAHVWRACGKRKPRTHVTIPACPNG
jgi:hypothetical protein